MYDKLLLNGRAVDVDIKSWLHFLNKPCFFDFALTISFARAGMIPRDIIKIVFRHVCVKMLKSMMFFTAICVISD